MFLTSLPVEISSLVYKYLDHSDVVNLSLTCKSEFQNALPWLYRKMEVYLDSKKEYVIGVRQPVFEGPNAPIRSQSFVINVQDQVMIKPPAKKRVQEAQDDRSTIIAQSVDRPRETFSYWHFVRVLKMKGSRQTERDAEFLAYALTRCTNLLEIRIQQTKLTESICDAISRHSNLKSLSFLACSFEGLRLNALFSLNTLEVFEVSRCRTVSDFLITNIAVHNRGLIRVDASHCGGITSKCIEELLTTCRGLKELILSECYNVSPDFIPKCFSHPTKVEEIFLDGMKMLKDEHVAYLAQQPLRVISFENCIMLTDNSLIMLSHLPRVKLLNFAQIFEVTTEGIKAFMSIPRPDMETIFLGRCWKVCDEGAFAIARACPNLKNFYSAADRMITDEGVLQIIQYCPDLEVLSVPGCDISDRTVDAACVLHKTLKVAQFSFCPDISPESVTRLAAKCHNLEILQLVGCRKILSSFVAEYSQPCPDHLIERYDGNYCAIRQPRIRALGLRAADL